MVRLIFNNLLSAVGIISTANRYFVISWLCILCHLRLVRFKPWRSFGLVTHAKAFYGPTFFGTRLLIWCQSPDMGHWLGRSRFVVGGVRTVYVRHNLPPAAALPLSASIAPPSGLPIKVIIFMQLFRPILRNTNRWGTGHRVGTTLTAGSEAWKGNSELMFTSHSVTGPNVQYLFERTPTAFWSLRSTLALRRTPILCHALEPRGWWAVFVSQVYMCDICLVTKQVSHKALFWQVRKTTQQLCGSGSMREKLSAVLPAAPTTSWSTMSCLNETKRGPGSGSTEPTVNSATLLLDVNIQFAFQM